MKRKTFLTLHALNVAWFVVFVILVFALGGCAAESCTRIDGLGVKADIGCDKTTAQPVTRSETLERTQNENAGDRFEK